MQSARRLYEASLAIQKQFRNAGRYFGWAVFALGLIGFIAHQEAYAICFILLGFSVAVSPTDEDTMQRKLASTAAAAVAVFWALATTYVFFAAASANSPFVYMTPTIAIAVMALGICLVAIDTKSPSLRASIQLIASLATLSGIFVLIAYGFEVRQVFEARAISRIPLSAAAAIAISGLAILLLRPDRGFIKLFVSSKLGGTATRSALPWAFLLPFLLGRIVLTGEHLGFYDSETRFVIVVTCTVLIYLTGAWFNGLRIDRIDNERIEFEKSFQLVVEAAPSAMIMADKDGKMILVNHQAELYFGYSRAEMLGKSIDLLLPERFRAGHPDHRHSFHAKPETRSMGAGRNLYALRKDQSEFPVEIGLNPIQLGEQIAVLSVIVDITERKAAEKKQQSFIAQIEWERAQLDAIFHTVNDGITVFNTEGEAIFVNDAAARIAGYPSTAAMKRDLDHFSDVFELSATDGRILSVEQWPPSRVLRGETLAHLDLNARNRETGQEWLFSYSGAPVRDESGKIALAVVINRDVTELRRTQKILSESEERFRTMVNALPQLAWMTDVSGNILWFNRRWCEYTGLLEGENDPEKLLKVYHPDDRTRIVEEWEKSLRSGQPFIYEARALEKATGHHRWFLARALPIFDEARKITRWLGTLTDIDDLKEAQAQIAAFNSELEITVRSRTAELENAVAELQAVNKELDSFSYSVSHDLRSPLRAIDGFSRILISDYAKQLPPDAQDYLGRIRSNSTRMGQLVDDLLAFSRIGRQSLQKNRVDMNALVGQTLEELKPIFANRKLEITKHSLPPCLGDATLLRQVWVNLLSNAMKYTGPRDRAEVEIGALNSPRAEPATYFVRDNGVGFNMAHAQNLFGVFQRMHRMEDFEGTGVGLAIVQKVVHKHGGKIWAEAEVDKGATFFFTLEG